MKKNFPVTTVEQAFPEGEYLVSKTDLKGAITYANDAFVAISGFDRDELIGKNHNLVRHPDMPPAAFEDLWRTIKSGYPWQGLVKNRCKNGDFYWVNAFVVPVSRHDEIVGYMSVRSKPTAEAVAKASALYAQMNAGRARLGGRLPWYRQIGLAARLRLLMGLATLIFAALAGIAWQGGAGADGTLRAALIGTLVAAACLVVLPGWLLAGRLSVRMKEIIHHFSRMGQGHLNESVDITGRDETGRALAELAAMQVSLKVMLDEIRAASAQIAQEAMQVMWQTANVVDQSEQQRERAASVAASTEEFSQSVREVADNANHAAGAADDARLRVGEAQASMDASVQATARVVDSVKASSHTIGELGQAIAKIGDITSVIREIADQTNLLALNAAIEAARAGEAGRGFAVVADEVRKLAERTALSTRDIAANVTEIRRVADLAVGAMDEAVVEVENGIGMIRASGENLARITDSSVEVSGMAHDIAGAASEQAMASENIAQNMERVAALVEGNLESAAAANKAVEKLNGSADYLGRIIRRFKLF